MGLLLGDGRLVCAIGVGVHMMQGCQGDRASVEILAVRKIQASLFSFVRGRGGFGRDISLHCPWLFEIVA
jgi:hypothetical protein